VEIREIEAGELETLVTIAKAAQPREFASVSGFVDWRKQAQEMVWLLAEEDGEVRGAAYALTGWHTPRHRAIGVVLVASPRRVLVMAPLLAACAGFGMAWIATELGRRLRPEAGHGRPDRASGGGRGSLGRP